MNKVILMGRLTRDPEVRYSTGATPMAIARFSLAVDRRRKTQNSNEPDADFFNCTAFGKQAEFVEKYLKQGTKILLTGRVQNDNYTGRDGTKVYSVQIIVEEMEFAESKSAQGQSRQQSRHQAQPEYDMHGQPVGNGFVQVPDNLDDEDLPFC